MNLSLYVLRYLLVVFPGIATIYESESIDSEGVYVMFLLAYLFFLQQKDTRWEIRFSSFAVSPLLLVELAALSALVERYEGMLPVAYLSALFPLYTRPNNSIPQTILIAAVMDYVAYSRISWLMLLTLNLVYVAIALLLYRLAESTGDKRKIEGLYDRLKQQHYELETARKTVVEYAAKVQEMAQIEERNRIAHDLHDDLGHRLIRLKMMLEAAGRLEPDNRNKVLDIVRDVRDQLGEGMESLRSTVRRLKPAQSLTSQYSLERLIGEFAKECGITVSYGIVGKPYPLYPSDEFILYRNAQEAITNAIRHGQATQVAITLAYAPERLSMAINNNGASPDASIIRKGLGLMGMEDRVRVVGGSVEITTKPIFEIVTRLPRRGPAMKSAEGDEMR